ncbi:Transmembrane osmosensor [Blastocladiella emersonii ATCC 22665]|nr:Transmembrane osmosensor [Blastocladiella emersonii ATCC 22665]
MASSMKAAGGFTPANLWGSLFLLVTAATAFIGWLVSFIGLIIITTKVDNANGTSVGWFTSLFSLTLLAATLVLVMMGNFNPGPYRWTLAHALVFDSVLTVTFMEKVTSAKGLGVAVGLYLFGTILLLIVQLLWVVYLTAEQDSPLTRALERYDAPYVAEARALKRRTMLSMAGPPQLPFAAPVSPITIPMPNHGNGNGGVPPMPNGGLGQPMFGNLEAKPSQTHLAPAVEASGIPAAQQQQPANDAGSEVGSSVESLVFAYRAKALFAYAANPEDPQEVSFDKDEIMDIANPHGNRWWQARRANGQVGIVPSNYLQLLQ